jgi:hypothetical protein
VPDAVWVKDAESLAPKTVYTAPVEAHPIVRVIYDPDADDHWTIEYAHLQGPGDTKETIEALIGV